MLMNDHAASPWTKFSQLMANVESLRSRVRDIEESDPQLGARWKRGMLRYWSDQLAEAVDRAGQYASEAGIDVPELRSHGS